MRMIRITPSATPATLISVRVGRWRMFDRTRLSIDSGFLLRLVQVGLFQIFGVIERECPGLQWGIDLKLFVAESQPRGITFVRASDQDHARPGVVVVGTEFLVVGVLNFGRELSLLVENLLPGEARAVSAVEPEAAADARGSVTLDRKLSLRDDIKTSQNPGATFRPLARVRLLDERLFDSENEARVIQDHRTHHQSFGEMKRASRRDRALFIFPFTTELRQPIAVVRVIRPDQKTPVLDRVVDRDLEVVGLRNHVREFRSDG